MLLLMTFGWQTSLAAKLQVVVLDDYSVVVYSDLLLTSDSTDQLLRVTSLRDTTLVYLADGQFWSLDGDCEPGISYQWLLKRKGVPLACSDWITKRMASVHYGLLEPDDSTLPVPLLYSTGELSCEEYSRFCKASEYPPPDYVEFPQMRNYFQFFLDYPVVNVSWIEAVRYCNWKSREADLPPAYDSGWQLDYTSSGFRLPTIEEMDRLADLQNHKPNLRHDETLLYPQPCSREGKRGRIQHVIGNVWEWLHNSYSTDGAEQWSSQPLLDLYFLPDQGDARLVYGGSWETPPEKLGNSVSPLDRGSRYVTVGFRVVRFLVGDQILQERVLEQHKHGEDGE